MTDSASPDPRARTPPRPRKTDSASPDPRARTQPRLRKAVFASPDPRARTQPRPRTTISASHDPGPGLSLDLGGAPASPDLGLGPTTSQRGHHYPTSSWLRLRGTRPASHPARPGKQVMMAPRVLHDDGGSQPLTEARRRQQGSDSPDSCTSMVLKRSSDGHDIT
jgi:hypothetical protein